MPIYEFKCPVCGNSKEVIISNKSQNPICCNTEMKQMISGPSKTPNKWK